MKDWANNVRPLENPTPEYVAAFQSSLHKMGLLGDGYEAGNVNDPLTVAAFQQLQDQYPGLGSDGVFTYGVAGKIGVLAGEWNDKQAAIRASNITSAFIQASAAKTERDGVTDTLVDAIDDIALVDAQVQQGLASVAKQLGVGDTDGKAGFSDTDRDALVDKIKDGGISITDLRNAMSLLSVSGVKFDPANQGPAAPVNTPEEGMALVGKDDPSVGRG